MVLKALTSSPVALFIKQCSVYEKIMLAAVLRCVRREGVPEVSWLSVSGILLFTCDPKTNYVAMHFAGLPRSRQPNQVDV